MAEESDWPPLESDPKIFTDYFHKLGTPEDVHFMELLSLDYKEFLQICGPVLGVILNYSRPPRKPEEPKPKLKEFPIKPQTYLPFFMKQTDKLDNACGLIAGLHTLGNAGHVVYKDESFLKRFFIDCKDKTAEERAKMLEKDEKCHDAHQSFSKEGQTNVKEVKNVGHYVTFIFNEGDVLEVNGLKPGPFLIQEGAKIEDLVDIATKEIMRRVQEGEISEQLSVMLCCDQNSNVIDLLGGDF